MYVHCTYYISICWRRWIFYKSGGAHSRPSPLARTQYTSKQVRYFFYLQKEMARDVIDSHSLISLISEKDFKTTPGRRKKW